MKVKGKKILVFIGLGFVLLNLIWLLVTAIRYDKFAKAVPKDKYGLYSLIKDGYSYYIKKPDYLHYTGNLVVKNVQEKTSLFIWPLMSGGYKYGFRFEENGSFYDIYLDNNLEAEAQGNTFDVQKIEEHRADLNTLFSKANEMWQLKSDQTKSQSLDQSITVTFDDQKQVEEVIKGYLSALEKKDYSIAWELTSSEQKKEYPKVEALKSHWGFESIKLVSIRGYLPSQGVVDAVPPNTPTIWFIVTLDIQPTADNPWNKGVSERFVNVVKDSDGKWRIGGLATGP